MRDGAFEQMSSLGEYLTVLVGLAFRIAPCGELWAKEFGGVAPQILKYVRCANVYKIASYTFILPKNSLRCLGEKIF